MLEIDTSCVFRSATQLAGLVAAVDEASSHDELDWLEWKSSLDLADLAQRGHIARHILGMGNRDADRAARSAGGLMTVARMTTTGSPPQGKVTSRVMMSIGPIVSSRS